MFNSIDAILISALLAGNVFGLIIALVRRSNKKKKIKMNLQIHFCTQLLL